MKKQYLEIGKIVSTHGIRGEVRVQPWCDSGEFLTEFETLYFDHGKKTVKIESSRVQKNVVVMKIAGVNTIEEAQKLRNQILYMDRNDVELEEGCYFIQDLIGIKVVDAQTARCYGTISDVIATGANDVYSLTQEDGSQVLIPAIPDVVKETDIEKKIMRIIPLKGLFDDEN